MKYPSRGAARLSGASPVVASALPTRVWGNSRRRGRRRCQRIARARCPRRREAASTVTLREPLGNPRATARVYHHATPARKRRWGTLGTHGRLPTTLRQPGTRSRRRCRGADAVAAGQRVLPLERRGAVWQMTCIGGEFGARLSARRLAVAAMLAWALAAVAPLAAQQPLETETARLPARGALLTGLTYEFQTSPQGTEHAVPFAFEYGVTDRVALLVEPVLFTAIRPRAGRRASGIGDLETTLQLLVRRETSRWPALALAAEAKIPTARDTLIGTRRADFTPYLIASKAFGATEVHANVGYSFVGKPPNVSVQNTLNFALAVEHHATARVDLLAEVLSTTAAGTGAAESATAPEIAGAEQVGMIGARYALRPHRWLSLGVTYDNTSALLLRPGLTIEAPF